MKYELYVDGACCVHRSRDGGWAVITPFGENLSGYVPQTTNNRMELIAVREALKWSLDHNLQTVIYSDSQYVVKALNQWCKKWSINNWTGNKAIKNKDLWETTYPLFLKSKCEVKWVKGHNGNVGNEKADRLAVEAMNAKRSI